MRLGEDDFHFFLADEVYGACELGGIGLVAVPLLDHADHLQAQIPRQVRKRIVLCDHGHSGERGEFRLHACFQCRELTVVGRRVGGVARGVRRVGLREGARDVVDLRARAGRTDPHVRVAVQERNTFASLDDFQAWILRADFSEEGLHSGAVNDEQVGIGELARITGCELVVVQTADVRAGQVVDLGALHAFGHIQGGDVDRIE